MLTPGRKPQFGDQFDGVKKAAENVKDFVKDGAERREDRKKDRLRAKAMKGSEKARVELAAQITPSAVDESELSKVRWKGSTEYTENRFDTKISPAASPAPSVQEGHLGRFTEGEDGKILKDGTEFNPGVERYSRMGEVDATKEPQSRNNIVQGPDL